MARELRSEVPNREFRVFPVNMDECSNTKFYQDVAEQLNTLDISILVNNTDLDYYNEFGNIKLRQCKSMVFVNCLPPVLLTRALLPKMIKRNNKSAVINVSCGAAVFPMAYYSAYVGSKALVDSFTKSLAVEFPEVDIMLYTPFDFVEKKENETYDFMTITAEESVRGALNDLGHQKKSYGHWRHRLQGYMYEKTPRWLFKHIYLEMVAPKFMKDVAKSQNSNSN